MKTQHYRLDSRILFFFMAVMLLAGSSFAYKYLTLQQCPEIAFEISDKTIEAGQMIMFTNKTAGVSEVAWDFGDNSSIEGEFHSSHTYTKPGEYTIRLTVNGRCSESGRVVVLPKERLIDESLIPEFTAPQTVELNKKVRFKCLTGEAESYEWRFGETGKVDSKERNPVYRFSTPGLKTVSLIINGNEKYIARQKVHVLTPTVKIPENNIAQAKAKASADQEPFIPEAPTDWSMFDQLKPEPVEEVKEEVKVMKNDELITAINEYSQGVAKLSQFKTSFCEKVETSLIEANGNLMKFPDFLESVKGHSLKVKELRTIRGEGGCINQVIIRYKK